MLPEPIKILLAITLRNFHGDYDTEVNRSLELGKQYFQRIIFIQSVILSIADENDVLDFKGFVTDTN